MKNSKPAAFLAGSLLLGSLVAIFLFTAGTPPRVDSGIHEEIGRALAQEAMKLLAPGGRLTVVTRDTDAFPQPALDIALASFRKEIRKAGATVAAVQTLQVDPLRPVQVPPGDFVELIRHGAAGDVLVSFMGPPLLSEEQRAGLGDIQPKIIAFCSGSLPGQVNLRLLAEQKLLHAAVLSRPGKPASPTAAGGRESFDDRYVRADAAGLARLSVVATQP